MITVIITASPIPSHPSTALITQVIESIKKHVHPKDLPIILAHDMPKTTPHVQYCEYLVNLNKQYADDKNIKIVVAPCYGHLSGNLKHGLEHVDTEYVLVGQHDVLLIKDINLEKVVEDMQRVPIIKYVMGVCGSNKRAIRLQRWHKGCTYELQKHYATIFKYTHYNYIKTPSWLDTIAFTTVDYFNRFVWPFVPLGVFPERVMNNLVKQTDIGAVTPDVDHFGTFLLGEYADGYTKNLNGRKFQ